MPGAGGAFGMPPAMCPPPLQTALPGGLPAAPQTLLGAAPGCVGGAPGNMLPMASPLNPGLPALGAANGSFPPATLPVQGLPQPMNPGAGLPTAPMAFCGGAAPQVNACAFPRPPMGGSLPSPMMPPGQAPPSGGAEMPSSQGQVQATLVFQNPELATNFTLQAANQYEQVAKSGIRPEVQELAEHFGLDDRSTRALDSQMRVRQATFEADMEALWEILGSARNPSGLLMVKVREMAEGIFRGFSTPEKNIADFAKQHKLDLHAAAKLAEVLAKRPDPAEDMRKLAGHLERSNKPSALMMLMLKDLRAGLPVKEPEHQAAVGSKAHSRELKERDRSESRRRKRSRSRSHRYQRHKSRSRKRRDRSGDRRRR